MVDRYEVGYRKPPVKRQFISGVSGNLKGRPKGKKKNDISDFFEKELSSMIVLADGSKISKNEAIIKQFVNKSVIGDAKYLKIYMDLMLKKEKKTCADNFYQRMIQEKYITEEDANDYAKYKKGLNTNFYPSTIVGVASKLIINKTTAWECVKWMETIASIYVKCENIKHCSILHQKVSNAYNFWAGVESGLSALELSPEEKQLQMKKIEENKAIKFVSKDIYNTSLHLYKKFYYEFFVYLLIIRNELKKIDFYKEQEKDFFGEEDTKRILEQAKSELNNEGYLSVLAYSKTRKDIYNNFMEIDSEEMNQLLVNLDKGISKDESIDFFEWFDLK